ncbi:MAG: peptidoglycan DD-metalloendopeptidase family protein [Lachnospiraceae bacterium]|nr:peptidoglycan DD-metalloendopeptidase family protein [Lachnospiraceae bacterium]MBQ8924197.1 peptidoglycan DD-metalloendopeptidase family protein [Lachnospiraceae bacterium]
MRRMRRILKAALAFVIVGSMGISSHATSITDLEGQKEELKDKKQEAQAIVDKMDSERDNILAAIQELDNQVAELNTQINDLETQKTNLNDAISVTELQLSDAEEKEQEQYDAMKLRIQYTYENDDYSYLDVVFTSSDISSMVNQEEYGEQVYNYDSEMLNDLIEIKQEISDTKDLLNSQLDEVQVIEDQLTEDRDAVQIMIEGKETQISNYNASIDGYNAQIAQYQADMDSIDAQIAAIMEERRKAEAAAITQGLNVPIYYTGGNFQWPVSSGGIITSTFGPRWGTVHQGLDIACPIGTPILAGESGTVIVSHYSSSAGEYIVIDHGNGVATEYMHNSQRLVSVGDYVTRGQVIAYSGSTGYSTGPHCHFGVRINGTRVDPQPYL